MSDYGVYPLDHAIYGFKKATSAQQRANRLALADILEHRITDAQFNMCSWSNDCGTVGCALGIAALSGEFAGLGWNNKYGARPVVGGKLRWWEDVGPAFFGAKAYSNVFTSTRHIMLNNRKAVARALRAIK